MAAIPQGCEGKCAADIVPGEDTAGLSSQRERMGAAQPITITHAALCGALLCALVAFMQGGAILTGFGVMLGQVGFFENEGIAIAYAGRSLLGLLLIVLAAAAMGALAWSIGAVLWNRIVTKYPTRGESAD